MFAKVGLCKVLLYSQEVWKIKTNTDQTKIFHLVYQHDRTCMSTTFLTISSMSLCSPEVSSSCAPWPLLACSHQWFHGWLQLFLDYSCVVVGAKGKTRWPGLWICELSWKARGLVLMERGWTHIHWARAACTHSQTHTERYQIREQMTLQYSQLSCALQRLHKANVTFVFFSHFIS